MVCLYYLSYSKMGKSDTRYWLCLAVVVLYHDIAVLALSLQDTDFALREFENEIDHYRREASSNTDCEEWQVFNGNECVCADASASRCTNKGGMVCDKAGNKYQSNCQYSIALCQGKINMDEGPSSCGFCDAYRLVRGLPSENPHTEAVFVKINTSSSIPTYQFENSSLFRVDHLKTWAVGFTNDSGDYISALLTGEAVHPQDGQAGMLVLKQNATHVYWETDPFLRFECSNGKEETFSKRFIFTLIFTIVAAAVTVTTTVLKVVQAKKGCLYYPSVCDLRNEINNDLRPEVIRMRDNYKRKYGEPQQFKNVLEDVQNQTITIKENLVKISELYVSLNKSMAYIDDTLGSIKTEFPDFAGVLTVYTDWQKSLLDQIPFNILGLELELIGLAYSISTLTAQTVSNIAAAASIIGSVIAIAFSIVDVVQSVLQEKKVKGELEDAKRKLVTAKNNIIKGTRSTEEVQRKLCQSIITFVYKLCSQGANYHTLFFNLKSFLSASHFSSSTNCYNRAVYEGSSYKNLKDLRDSYLKPLLEFTQNSITELKAKIQEVKATEGFLNGVKTQLREKRKSPKDIFRDINRDKPALAKDAFSGFFSLLKYAAKEIFPTTQCYWGYDLAAIRRETLNERNLDHAAVCRSPEIQSFTNIIVNSVSAGTAPCRIVSQVSHSGDLFHSVIKVIQYIANHILQSNSCYWGYDLQSFRDRNYPSDVNNAKMTSAIFTALTYFTDATQARNMLCTSQKVCDSGWQTFLLCTKWAGSAKGAGLDCSRASANPHTYCTPPNLTVEKCNV